MLAHGKSFWLAAGVTVVYRRPHSLSGLAVTLSSRCPLALQESLFPARVVYDLLFFFIVIIIVLNLIFGVIIDTFADLRSEKQKKEEILKTTCFICGEAHALAGLCPTARPEASKPRHPVPSLLTWPVLGSAGFGEAPASSPWASRKGT